MKLSHTLLSQYVGDLLITQGGNYVGPAKLVIVHWDGSEFITRGIELIAYARGSLTAIEEIEGVAFAPINISPIP